MADITFLTKHKAFGREVKEPGMYGRNVSKREQTLFFKTFDPSEKMVNMDQYKRQLDKEAYHG